MSLATIAKTIKRKLALATLAFADVSKSAVSNQKETGLESAPQAVTQSVYSADKQTIHDMVRGRQNAQTKIMADKWWRGYIGAKRSIIELIDGVPTSRELTEEEWRARWEKLADPANKDLGGVVMHHEVLYFFDENAADTVDAMNEAQARQGLSGREKMALVDARREATRHSNYHVSSDPGFYFPLQSIHTVLVRQDLNENFALELHTDLQHVEPMQVATASRERVLESMRETMRLEAFERYERDKKDLEYDVTCARRQGVDAQAKVDSDFTDLTQKLERRYAEIDAYELLSDPDSLDTETSQNNVTYAMTMDPEMRYLLTGIRRVALVQEEYSGLVNYAFALEGEPRVTTPHGKIVLTYRAKTTMVTAEEVKALGARTISGPAKS